MLLFEQAKPYWEAVRRYNLYRTTPGMHGVALRAMRQLEATNTSPAVGRRINSFIAGHSRPKTPGGSSNGGGPNKK